MFMTRLAASTVLVTGAASGIGRRLSLGVAARGGHVVAWDLDGEKLKALRTELAATAPGVHTTVVCPCYVNTGMFDGVQTRFPMLLPILEEEAVAKRILAAIENDRAQVIMPPLVHVLPLARILPVRFFDWIAGFFGINRSMDHFRGRALGAR
jgi:all-trans-retinol dehydrogenase (NAD+)